MQTGKLSRLRRVTRLACCVLVWLFFIWQVTSLQPLTSAKWMQVSHFLEYWAAGRLQLTGHNPYAPELLLELQQSVGWNEPTPIMMWNPPWTLPFVMPFAQPSYSVGHFLWLIFRFAVVLFCAHWIWCFYGASARHYWIAWVLTFTFAPTLVGLVSGQIGPLILLGLVGFMHFEKHKQLWLAGVFLLLISIKPHLLYLLWFALLLWVFDGRRWSLFVSTSLGGILLTATAFIFNSAVLAQYLQAVVDQPPPAIPIHDWASPTLGGLLRFLLGLERFYLQFVPPLVGALWFLSYWRKHKREWNWGENLPLITLVSLTTTAYGWTFDHIVLLPALLQAANQIVLAPRMVRLVWMILAYVTLNIVAVSMNVLGVNEFWFFWLAPTWLFIYIALVRQVKAERSTLLAIAR